MKAFDIVLQLRNELPKYTNLFGDMDSVLSLTRTGSLVTATTTNPHGLITGETVVISGALTPIQIVSLTQTNNIATAITLSPHDFTDNYTTEVLVEGAVSPLYNGLHKFVHQPNRRTFEYVVDGNPPSPDPGTEIYVLEHLKQGYNGAHVVTVIDETSFSYEIESSPGSPARGDIFFSSKFRISAAISINRVIESYTPQVFNQLWLFVILGPTASSKSRFIETDNTDVINPGVDYRQRLINTVYLYVVGNSENEISGAAIRDLMQDLLSPIFKSILRVHFPSGLSDRTNFGVVFVGHDIQEYRYPYYIHQFTFENTYDVTNPDTVDTDNSVAFRNIKLNFLNKFDNIIAKADIDLDDTPIIDI